MSNESFSSVKLSPAALPVPFNVFIFLFPSAFFILSVINEPPVEFSESSTDLEASPETVKGGWGGSLWFSFEGWEEEYTKQITAAQT